MRQQQRGRWKEGRALRYLKIARCREKKDVHPSSQPCSSSRSPLDFPLSSHKGRKSDRNHACSCAKHCRQARQTQCLLHEQSMCYYLPQFSMNFLYESSQHPLANLTLCDTEERQIQPPSRRPRGERKDARALRRSIEGRCDSLRWQFVHSSTSRPGAS